MSFCKKRREVLIKIRMVRPAGSLLKVTAKSACKEQRRSTDSDKSIFHLGTRGRRGGRGSGRGGRNRNDKPSKPKSKEDLDRELDAYVLGDAKSAQAKLNGDLDEYFAQKEKKASDKPASEKAADEPAAAS